MQKAIVILGIIALVGITIGVHKLLVHKIAPPLYKNVSTTYVQSPQVQDSVPQAPQPDCAQYGSINPYDMPAYGALSSQQNEELLCQSLNSLPQDLK